MTDQTAASQPLERVTVNLIPKASQALERAASLTGDSKTDVINRALQVYAFVEQILHDDGAVSVQGANDAVPQQIKIS
jgi:uncharacterized protein (DUF1778 family)